MAWVVTAVVAAFEVTTVATVLTAISAVGMATTVVGAVTGNKNLMKIGGEISMVGGIGSLVNAGIGALGAAGADVAAGQIGAEAASQAAGDAATDAASDALGDSVSDAVSDGLAGGLDSAELIPNDYSKISGIADTTPGTPGSDIVGSDLAGKDLIGNQATVAGADTANTVAQTTPINTAPMQPPPIDDAITGAPVDDVLNPASGTNGLRQPGLQFNTNGTVNTTTSNKFAVAGEDLAGGLDSGELIPNDYSKIQGVVPGSGTPQNQSFLDKLGSKWDSLSPGQKMDFAKMALSIPGSIQNQRNQQAALDIQRQKLAQTSYGSDVPRFGIINSVRRT
ncbi:hypothetical protein H8L32_16785 [Undibacterium sp. CY18W]|uniref:Uncharacterized protein n=1 Tax=Undibacterium hunanense TaxID=2762292 RepID=A0ABR6ZTG6_9BURK|nr:hypothetical protein [Undibacterium hunanense]MBC3919150.1 hypothetical protein [Undibacterium hunanense]